MCCGLVSTGAFLFCSFFCWWLTVMQPNFVSNVIIYRSKNKQPSTLIQSCRLSGHCHSSLEIEIVFVCSQVKKRSFTLNNIVADTSWKPWHRHVLSKLHRASFTKAHVKAIYNHCPTWPRKMTISVQFKKDPLHRETVIKKYEANLNINITYSYIVTLKSKAECWSNLFHNLHVVGNMVNTSFKSCTQSRSFVFILSWKNMNPLLLSITSYGLDEIC